jgi:hypothetical protein
VFEVNAQFALREIFEWPTDANTWSLRPKYFDRVLVLEGDSPMTSDLAIIIEREPVYTVYHIILLGENPLVVLIGL